MKVVEGNSGKNRYKNYDNLAGQYRIAAASLWGSILEAPYLFNPCIFLARHTVELLLKGLIYRDCENASTSSIEIGGKKKTVDNTHDLSALWQYYLDEKQPSMFPTEDEANTIGEAIGKISQIDEDSTKYRYPETKKPVSTLKLEPIKINEEAIVAPDISKNSSLFCISPDSISVVTRGENSLKLGDSMFELIEALCQLLA